MFFYIPVSSTSRTLLLVLSLELLSPVISLPSYALSTGPESRDASYTSSSYLTTNFSQLAVPNLHACITSLPPSSSSVKITDRSFLYAALCLWNQLPLSLRQSHSGASSSSPDLPTTLPGLITSSCSVSPLLIHNSLSLSLPA